jgi:hypothetical protein
MSQTSLDNLTLSSVIKCYKELGSYLNQAKALLKTSCTGPEGQYLWHYIIYK